MVAPPETPAGSVTVFLSGDVMTGRGVDQILPHPGDPQLWEGHVTDARTYLALAAQVNGPLQPPVDPGWPWGEALRRLTDARPDARVINLETSVTGAAEPEPGKAVHYRMAPANLDTLRVAAPDVCVLANNHTLDFGRQGLRETLATLAAAGLPTAGAGEDATAAAAPVAVPVAGGDHRVLVFACGSTTSGIPPHWAATRQRSGVNLLPDLTPASADALTAQVRAHRRAGDLVVVSIHWGSNWGYEVAPDQPAFAHRLIEGGVDVVHGHSSHHPRPIEVYRDRLILYGCGDLVNDYEGIGGYEQYRDDLRLLYLASLAPATGALLGLAMVPVQARRLRLEPAAPADAALLAETLDRISRRYGCGVAPSEDGTLHLRWRPDHDPPDYDPPDHNPPDHNPPDHNLPDPGLPGPGQAGPGQGVPNGPGA